jgi:cytosine/adenosine deaminase-related metal-dependent hydrolase
MKVGYKGTVIRDNQALTDDPDTRYRAMQPFIIDVGAVLDGTGSHAQSCRGVLVAGDRIVAVDTADAIRLHPRAADATVIDARNATLLPGPIDGHLHIGWRTAADIAIPPRQPFLPVTEREWSVSGQDLTA